MTTNEAAWQAVEEAPPQRERLWRRLMASRSGRWGVILSVFVLGLAVLAAIGATPYDPISQRPIDRLQGPSTAYLFGTDQFGRDILSRSMAGVGTSLQVAIVAVFISAVLGTTFGILAGFFGNRVRGPVNAMTNILFAFPPLLLALALASVATRNWFTVAAAIAIVYIPIFVRVTRAPVLTLREADFIKAAQVLGFPSHRILFRHLLPNIMPVVIVQVTLSMSWAVLTAAALSYLGLGTPPPTPALGSMVFEAKNLVAIAPWTMIAPGLVLIMFVVGLNLLGDGLRDALDPRNESHS
jgi:peptide/nickel transport system permease protein